MNSTASGENIIKAFERAASVKPGAPLVAGVVTLTYGELLRRASLLTGLLRKAGLRPGDRAVVSSIDDTATVTIFLALLRSGIAAVIIDPDTSNQQARALISMARPKAAFIDAKNREEWLEADIFTVEVNKDGLSGGGLFGRLLKKKGPADPASYPAILDTLTPEPAPQIIPDDLTAYVIFTSGTTSLPRGVEISHRSLFAHLSTLTRQYGYSRESRILNVLPLHHADGLIQGPVAAFFNGCAVYRPMQFSVQNIPALLDSVYSGRITHMVAVPTMLSLMNRFADGYEDALSTGDFQFVISTAAHLEEDHWRSFEERFRTRVVNVYGLTETVAGSFFSGPGDASRRVGTIGKPVDCEARIVDEERGVLPTGTPGELEISGSHLMKGYLDDPGATEAALKDGWLRTGDIAVKDADGFYRIVGRKKNIIISAGINIHPEEVTSVLKTHPSVTDAVTFGVKDEVRGERVVSCVTITAEGEVGAQDLHDFCRSRLAPSKTPEKIQILAELPKGPSGKIIIEKVIQLYENAAEVRGEGGYRDLRGRVVSAAARAFRLPPSELKPDSNSSNTPQWDSLGHIEFAAALEEEFGVALATVDILKIRTLADAERVISEKNPVK